MQQQVILVCEDEFPASYINSGVGGGQFVKGIETKHPKKAKIEVVLNSNWSTEKELTKIGG